MMAGYRAALIDLDGTLLDQSATQHACCLEALAQLDEVGPSLAAFRRSLGASAPVWMRHFVPSRKIAPAVALYQQRLAQAGRTGVVLLPGCRPFLRTCRESEVKLALLTNRSGNAARSLLRSLELDAYFAEVFGLHDTRWRKPEPGLARFALLRLGAHSRLACVVGDSPIDVELARAGGLDCIAVATGAHTARELNFAGATHVIDSLFRAITHD